MLQLGLALVQLLQLLDVLKRPVRQHGLPPGYVGRSWDVPAPQGAFLRIIRYVQQFAAVFSRRAHVNERFVGLDVRHDLLTEGALSSGVTAHVDGSVCR
jgi:hypothetical protein